MVSSISGILCEFYSSGRVASQVLINFRWFYLAQRINCLRGRKWKGIISSGCELRRLGLSHTPDSIPQIEGDTWPFCSFFTIASKSSDFFEDLVCPVEMKTKITGSSKRGDWGKVQAYLGREKGVPVGSADTPGLELKTGWGPGFRPEQGPCRTPCLACSGGLWYMLDESGLRMVNVFLRGQRTPRMSP